MLRRIVFATILVALIVVCRPDPGPAARAPAAGAPAALHVPEAFQGAWYVGQSCSNVASYFFRGDGWWVTIAEQADRRTIVAGSSAFSALQVEEGGAMVVSAYWADPGTGEYAPAKFRLTPAGSRIEGAYIFPPAATKVPKIFEIRCDHPKIAGKPWQLASRYLADLTAILGAASVIQQACNSGPHACAGAIIAALDLNRDGKISPAELVSFARRASKIGFLVGRKVPGTFMLHAEFTLDQVTAAELGAATIGPIFAPIVMANVDYNGDGFIEADELETLLRQIGMPPAPGTFTSLVESAKGSADQAARSLGALQQLLGGH